MKSGVTGVANVIFIQGSPKHALIVCVTGHRYCV